ncbi:flagellar biosynthesis protein FlhF [Halanaerobacter jeridensis]|uniref:Flagellar biosynthesis protein FlhF n=1 Tax=Halanaerobacter jeridensis TaxID=706427 RepID=A0A938XN48_9FIRM|nr:flagellar biosynthesis protein FlhF [Halanaerobacter jeridensis]MBM7555358.1 flagellar biosynthesis protein FlhF [Halanaerobacter jeridensis]
MKVKKYKAPTMQEAVLKVKSDLGSDAIILDTRKFEEGGFLGFFTDQVVEVMATVEGKTANSNSGNKTKNSTADEDVKNNLEALKGQMDQLVGEIDEIKDKKNNSFNVVGNSTAQSLIESLLNLGFSYETACQLTQNVFEKNNSYNLDEEEIKENLREELAELMQLESENKIDLAEQTKVVALVGPTGVGKTTTLAKLAADFALQQNKRVGLVTADTYRIAAVDQLKTYSEIIDIPLQVAFSPQELENTIEEYNENYDLIFVDTAGRSQNNDIHISELKGFVKKDVIDQVFLVISATTKTEDMKEIIEVYSQLNFDKFIVSKIDETNSLGVIFEALSLAQKPISYVTVGQDVPEDIEIADNKKLIDNIIEGVKL